MVKTDLCADTKSAESGSHRKQVGIGMRIMISKGLAEHVQGLVSLEVGRERTFSHGALHGEGFSNCRFSRCSE